MITRIRIAEIAPRLVAERHIAIRSSAGIRYLTLTRSAQITGLCLLLVGTAVLAQITIGYIASNRKAAHRAAAVAHAEISNDQLRGLVAQLQDRLSAALSQKGAVQDALYGDLAAQQAAAQTRVKAAVDLLANKTTEVARLNEAAAEAKANLRQEKKQRSSLIARIHDLEHDLQVASDEAARYRAAAEEVQQKLRKVSQSAARARRAERQAAAAAPAPEQVAATATANASAGTDNDVVPTRVAAITKASTAADGDGLDYLAGKTRQGWHDLIHLLASAGVDLDHLAAHYGATPRGEGGPFVALRGAKAAMTAKVSPEELRKLAKVLPLKAPVEHYQLTSGFGARSDPFRHREAFHSGVDLAVPYKTPVYNTAPGTVIFAGADGAYGKMVEIDHGSGIVTVYAHLHRITVARGEHLRHRVQIGQVGSTGRSTGPHVHYEVRLNGTPVDPETFLDAGKSIIEASAN